MYDYLIVGAGITGCILARELSRKGKKCLVIDRNSHVGGNCYSEDIEGVHVNLYGGHFFHTNNLSTWNYVNQFTKFNPYDHRVKSFYKGKIYSFPINLMTLNQIWERAFTPEEGINLFSKLPKVYQTEKNFKEKMINLIGKELYEIFFYGYTIKHWHREPENLPAELVNRIPVRYTYDDRYSSDLYQGMPENGYTPMFDKMLEGIDVVLNTPYHKGITADQIIWTGAIDEYYNYTFGKLEYISIEEEISNENLGCATINYPDIAVPFTRKICYNYFYPHKKWDRFITHTEYSRDTGMPAYPVPTAVNHALYEKYASLENKYVTAFCGRLGSYKYLDMNVAVEKALTLADKL